MTTAAADTFRPKATLPFAPAAGLAAPPAPAAMEAAPAVALPPADRDLLVQGIALQNSGDMAGAEALFRRYLAAAPNDAVALYSLGVVLVRRGDAAGALALLTRATEVAPAFAPTWFGRGSVLQGLGRLDEALHCYDQALARQPDYIEALVNSGTLLRQLRRHVEALERFNRVLQINPNYETALGNCGILLSEFKQGPQACAMFERLLQINPNYDHGLGLLAYERLHMCDWTDFELLSKHIVEGMRQGRRTAKSLPYMAIADSAEEQQTAARLFAAHHLPQGVEPLYKGERYRHRRIRLAYVSPDLREHPVGHLTAGIFERHDKQRFETFAISLGIDDKSRLRERMIAAFDHFIDASRMSSQEIAALMRAHEIDIAVDLAGYTADSRSDVFARRPAPAQVNWLGYPGTLGAKCFDYVVADRHVIPPEHQRFYDEQVVYLPDTYLPTDTGLQVAERTPTRAECGLPESGVVFCSFSHDYKINPPLFDIWMRLLSSVPGSVLWLVSRNELSQKNLRAEAAKRGVDPSRLVFAGRVPRVEDHLARYRQADVFLDTHPYNAHTTAADALLAGLPVVTRMGGAFPSRVAGSVLLAMGLPELVTDSVEAYEALALRLATEPALLADVKARIARNRHSAALFDTDAFTRNLEAIYIAMWRKTELCGAHDALS